jgi:hypothetical protein
MIAISACEGVGVATRIGSAQHPGVSSQDGEGTSRTGHTHPLGMDMPHLASLGSPGESMQSARRSEGGNSGAQACEPAEAAISACDGVVVATRNGPAQHQDIACQDGERPHQLHDEVAIGACVGVGVATRIGSTQHHGVSSHGGVGASHSGLTHPQGMVCVSAGGRVGVATRCGPALHHDTVRHDGKAHPLPLGGAASQDGEGHHQLLGGVAICAGEGVGVATRIGHTQRYGTACQDGEAPWHRVKVGAASRIGPAPGPPRPFGSGCRWKGPPARLHGTRLRWMLRHYRPLLWRGWQPWQLSPLRLASACEGVGVATRIGYVSAMARRVMRR